MRDRKYDLIGVGNAITDHLIQVEDDFLEKNVSGEKGGMLLAEIDEINSLINASTNGSKTSPGGAAANTVRTAARLGASSRFLGMLGQDDIGRAYIEAFKDVGCDVSAFRIHPEKQSGQCLSIITPDRERTMRTFLGAAVELGSEPISATDFADCDTMYVEGYLLFNRELITRVLALGKEAGCRIALDLGSFEVVRSCMDVLPELLENYVDIVMANEDEGLAFSGSSDLERSLAALAQHCGTAVLKLGDEGAWISSGERLIVIEPVPAPEVLDTTGAGDLWAAGFLYGLAQGMPLEHCGAIGSILGSAAVGEVGASIPEHRWLPIKGDIDAIVEQVMTKDT